MLMWLAIGSKYVLLGLMNPAPAPSPVYQVISCSFMPYGIWMLPQFLNCSYTMLQLKQWLILNCVFIKDIAGYIALFLLTLENWIYFLDPNAAAPLRLFIEQEKGAKVRLDKSRKWLLYGIENKFRSKLLWNTEWFAPNPSANTWTDQENTSISKGNIFSKM